jgi:hypothetical protein
VLYPGLAVLAVLVAVAGTLVAPALATAYVLADSLALAGRVPLAACLPALAALALLAAVPLLRARAARDPRLPGAGAHDGVGERCQVR